MRPTAGLVLLASMALAQAPKAWTPELQMQVKRLEQPRPSPDGRFVAYTVRAAFTDATTSEFRTRIHLVTSEGVDRPLTGESTSSTDPQWSPDGRSLAFRSARNGAKGQVWLLRLDGGEAEPLTDGKSEVTAFAWSPDGKRIAFTAMDAKTSDEEAKDKAKDDLRWHREQPKVARLFVIPLLVDAKGAREAKLLTPEARHVTGFDWSPDGGRIAYAHQQSPLVDHWTTSKLGLVDVASGTQRAFADSKASAASPRFSRDGKRLAFLTSSDAPPRWPGAHRVAVAPLEGSAPRILPATPDEDPSDLLGWSGDGQHLLLAESRATTGGLYAMKVEDGSLLRLNTGAWTLATGAMVGSGESVALDPSGRFLGLVLQSSSEAPALALSPIHAFAPKVLARPNADLPAPPLPRTELVHWKGPGGMDIEGLLSTPADAKPGVKLPLLLSIHGGPSQCFGETYAASPSQYPLAAFTAKGFAVLRANIRGSHGYGRPFRFANEQDWGGKDYEDLMAGVDRVIAMGVADPDRLGVMGWSYGGFMTSWILTRTHRFKAASVGAAVTDLVSFSGTTDIPGFIPDYFGGEGYDQTQRWLDHSPVFQVKGVKTPALIQHCEGDPRVPIGQGYEYFNALQRQGVEVRMQVAPRQNHGPTEPKALLRFAEANVEWFVSKLKP